MHFEGRVGLDGGGGGRAGAYEAARWTVRGEAGRALSAQSSSQPFSPLVLAQFPVSVGTWKRDSLRLWSAVSAIPETCPQEANSSHPGCHLALTPAPDCRLFVYFANLLCLVFTKLSLPDDEAREIGLEVTARSCQPELAWALLHAYFQSLQNSLEILLSQSASQSAVKPATMV